MTLRRQITFIPLIGIIFLSVSGGSYSLEELVSSSGPGLAFLLLLLVPIFYGIPIAAIVSELSAAIPADGGTYEWMRRTLGNFMSFQAGLLRWVNSWIDMAIYPVLFSSYITAFFPEFFNSEQAVFFSFGPLSLDLRWVIGLVFVIIPMALVNMRGSRAVGDSSVVITLIALIPLTIVMVLGIINLITNEINPFVPFLNSETPPGAAIAVGLSLVMWSYCGIDQIGVISGEVENPSKTIPKALTISLIVIALAYMLPLIGAMAVPGWQSWFAGSYVDIGAILGGTWLAIAVAIGGAISALGTYGALLLSNTRLPFVLARDAWITKRLARESKRHNSPVTAIVVSSVIYAVFAMGSFTDLVMLNVFTINLLLLMNLIALVVLRIREPNLHRPMKIPFGWVGIAAVGIPLVGGIVFLMVLQFSEADAGDLIVLVVALLAAVLAYVPARAHRRKYGAQVEQVST